MKLCLEGRLARCGQARPNASGSLTARGVVSFSASVGNEVLQSNKDTKKVPVMSRL